MSDVEQPELAYRRVLALTAALFLSYLTVAMSLPAVPVHVVHGLGLDNAYGGLAVGITFVSTILTRGWADLLHRELASTSHGRQYAVLIVGRLLLGVGESVANVGMISWALG